MRNLCSHTLLLVVCLLCVPTAVHPQLFRHKRHRAVAENPNNNVACNVTGECIECSAAEQAEDWSVCRSTGYRQAISCLVLHNRETGREGGRHLSNSYQEKQDATQEKLGTSEGIVEEGEEAAFVDGEVGEGSELEERRREKGSGWRGLMKYVRHGTRALLDYDDESSDPEYQASPQRAGHHTCRDIEEEHKRQACIEQHGGGKGGNMRAENRKFETFQSCTPPEGKPGGFSVLSFEGLMLILLCISAPVVVLRRRAGQSSRRG